MTEKSEALRLAEQLEKVWFQHEAAAELRQLHKENELLASAADKIRLFWRNEVHRLIAQRDTLLEALKTIKDTKRLAREMQQEWCPAAQGMVRIASAAIKAVEGE